MEALNISSGLLTVIGYALSSCRSLHGVVAEFQTHDKAVRWLYDELNSLISALESLKQINADHIANLPPLQIPLRACGQLCSEFEEIIKACSAKSHETGTSLWDHAQLIINVDKIEELRQMLYAYKSTITMVLSGVNLRISADNAEAFDELRKTAANLTSDLKVLLQRMEDRLQTPPADGMTISFEWVAQREREQKKKDSIEQCLVTCSHLLEQVMQSRQNLPDAASRDENDGDGASSILGEASSCMQQSEESLSKTLSDCRTFLQDHNKRGGKLPATGASSSTEGYGGKTKSQQKALEQMLAICKQMDEEAKQERAHYFHRVSAGDDTRQSILAKAGDLIRAVDITAGARSTQHLGQMPATSSQRSSATLNGKKRGNVTRRH